MKSCILSSYVGSSLGVLWVSLKMQGWQREEEEVLSGSLGG